MTLSYLLSFLSTLVSFLLSTQISEAHIVAFDEKSCPLRLAQNFTQNQLLAQLTSPCRYNKKHTPIDPYNCTEPLRVKARIHVYHLRSGSEANAEFKVQLLLQLHWRDPRLAYRSYAPHTNEMVGERNFISAIWTPHIYLTNERDSLVLGLYRRDMVVSILPDGDILFSTRLKTTIFCWVQLGKFPFDQQKCHLIMDSWRYNASELILEWDPHPVTIPASKPYLTEYHLMDTVTQVEDQFAEPSAVADSNHSYMYSSLTLTFILDRQYGFYMMDFYAPSILLVCISWVSFWMAPDAVPGRTILGASTMLTFFQLGIETGSSLPNVSYIRSNDVWFFACTVFIFLSLAEFAFVNTIWRYGDQQVEMKKATSKYILKSSVHPHLHSQDHSRRTSTSSQFEQPITRQPSRTTLTQQEEGQAGGKQTDWNSNDQFEEGNAQEGNVYPLPQKDFQGDGEELEKQKVDFHMGPIGEEEKEEEGEKEAGQKVEGEKEESKFKTHLEPPDVEIKKSLSCPSSPELRKSKLNKRSEPEHSESISTLDLAYPLKELKVPTLSIDHDESTFVLMNKEDPTPHYTTVMSMRDIAIWVDNKSKIVFPLAFTLFNATYWGVLYQS